MPRVQDQLSQRHPHWFRGRRGRITRPVLRAVARWTRVDSAEAFIRDHADLAGLNFVRAALRHLGVRCAVDAEALSRIPATGRLLIVANHPSGALDALALLDAVGQVRGDVRIVANQVLSAIAPLSDVLLPVRVFGGQAGRGSINAIHAALAREECVILFPAGEVSRLSPRGVRDAHWRSGFVRLARSSNAPVLPIRVFARNSALFYGASALFKPAGTALLAREIFARRQRPLSLHIGQAVSLPDHDNVRAIAADVRASLYQLGRTEVRDATAPVTASPEVLADAEATDAVAAGIASIRLVGNTLDGKEIRVGRLGIDTPAMRELGRLRELTFRAVGEGTGRARDIDEYDAWYEHIILWDAGARKIAGAYRVARGAQVLAERGLPGLYTASLFHYAESAIPRIAAGMELGRSFVVPDYWNSRSLDELWQGIGAYLRTHPEVRHLFGPVSISAALPPAARDALVAYYTRYFGGGDGLAHALRPFAYFDAPPDYGLLDADTAFKVLKENLHALGSRVPTLYKQYADLCEPGGARFLAFGVDPDFSNAIDGLIEVDLAAMRPNKRKRYLRPQELPA